MYQYRVVSIQLLLKQKIQMSRKLKRQVEQLKKQSMYIVRELKNDRIVEKYQGKTTKLNLQIKNIRGKIKQAEIKKQIGDKNCEKQLVFIRKIQRMLEAGGYGVQNIEVLRNKYNNHNNQYIVQQSRINQSYNNNNDNQIVKQTNNYKQYKTATNQIKLLQKMQKDHQQQLNLLYKYRQQATVINVKSRNQLLQTQDQIQRVQRKINQVKDKLQPSMLKPLRAYSSCIEGISVGRYGKVNKSLTAIKSLFNHIFKYQEIGGVSKNGRKFSDRPKIGKVSAKIVGIDLYQQKQGVGSVMGLQSSYLIKQSIKKCPLNMICDFKTVKKKSIILDDPSDYIKQIQCIMNENGNIIGISVVSDKGVSDRAGSLQGLRKPLSISKQQYPVCLYGSFNENGLQLLGVQIVQENNQDH